MYVCCLNELNIIGFLLFLFFIDKVIDMGINLRFLRDELNIGMKIDKIYV